MNNEPDPSDVWAGIGGHHDTFSQVLCEFIDNSISNIVANSCSSRTVQVRLEEVANDKVRVQIEDSGSGINDMEVAFRLGDRSGRQTPMNEHGFGLKHALASANPGNDSWAIYTRTRSHFGAGQYVKVSSPYTFNLAEETVDIHTTPWPGVCNGPGTLVQFDCSVELYNTLRIGIQGVAGFQKCVSYLSEDLGYIYSGMIKKGVVTIVLDLPQYGVQVSVPAIEPTWLGPYQPGEGNILLDLGAGEVKLNYHFGEMGDVSTPPSKRYYTRDIETSGVELRYNGRLIMSNLFRDIWQLAPHPLYNHLLVIVDLETSDIDRLPRTRTSKNGVRSGDEKLARLFDWIRRVHPDPEKKLSMSVGENELVEELRAAKEAHIRDPKHVEKNYPVFTHLGGQVKADLYVSDGREIVLYEAKKGTADVQDLYQLLMYWDGAISDGITPNEGILLASDFSPAVDAVISWLNSRYDADNNAYKFKKKTWREEHIPYPPP